MEKRLSSLFASHRPPLLLLAAFCILVSLPGLFMGLHADDWAHLKPRSAEKILATFAGDWNDGARGGGGFFRPMVRVPFAADHLLHGGSAAGSHFTNGLLFLGLSLAVYLCAVPLAAGRPFAAFLPVLLLLVLNPLRSEALYWVSGRTDLLAALFLFLALAFALRAMERHRPAHAILSLLLLAGGLLSKESAIAGCAIIPLAVLLLGGAGLPRLLRWLLLAGPLLLGLVYLVYRRAVLGGLGGYEVDEPREVWSFLRHGAMALSALFCPWQADSPGVYRPLLALPGLLLLLVMIPARSVPRPFLFAAVGLLLSLVPISFIAATPFDGSRVLVLPMGFLALAVTGLLAPVGSAKSQGRLLILGLVLAITFLPVQWSIWRQFLNAREPNARVIGEAAEWLDSLAVTLPDGEDVHLVVPEPPRSEPRRILDPGLAMIMALETHWLRTPGSATSSFTDPQAGRFGLLFERDGPAFVVAPALFPSLGDEVRRLVFPQPGQAAFEHLRQTAAGEVTAPGTDHPLGPLPPPGGVVTAVLVHEGTAEPPSPLSLEPAREDIRVERVRLGRHRLTLAVAEGGALAEARTARFLIPAENSSLRLRAAQWAVYAPVGSE